MANHLHQPVISMEAEPYTFSSHLTWRGVWECAWQFWGFTTKIFFIFRLVL